MAKKNKQNHFPTTHPFLASLRAVHWQEIHNCQHMSMTVVAASVVAKFNCTYTSFYSLCNLICHSL